MFIWRQFVLFFRLPEKYVFRKKNSLMKWISLQSSFFWLLPSGVVTVAHLLPVSSYLQHPLCHINPLHVLLPYISDSSLWSFSSLLGPGSSMLKTLCPIQPLSLFCTCSNHPTGLLHTSHFSPLNKPTLSLLLYPQIYLKSILLPPNSCLSFCLASSHPFHKFPLAHCWTTALEAFIVDPGPN